MDGDHYEAESYGYRGRRRGRGMAGSRGEPRRQRRHLVDTDEGGRSDAPVTRPTILTKPHADKVGETSTHHDGGEEGEGTEPVMTQTFTSQRVPPVPPSVPLEGGPGTAHLGAAHQMSHSVGVVDELFRWSDKAAEYLVEQTDYLVVGVVGLQGCGKSSLMSLLAGVRLQDECKSWPFSPQSRECKEHGRNRTLGIDMYVTSERIILLDTQPVLSSALMEAFIVNERKYPNDFNCVESFMEVQSLQLASFLTSVCHVVVAVSDKTPDLGFLRFLRTAEMLRVPAASAPSSDSSPSSDPSPEHFPHLVFALNKLETPEFSRERMQMMQQLVKGFFRNSKYRYKGSVTHEPVVRSAHPGNPSDDVNVIYIPDLRQSKDGNSSRAGGLLQQPGFTKLWKTFRNQLLSVPRPQLSPTPLTEKMWFHFAARTWEGIQRHHFFTEYNRFLP